MNPGEFDLRLTVYGPHGDGRNLTVRYRIDENRRPDPRPFEQAERELSMLRPEFLTPERRRRNLLTGDAFEEDAGDWVVRSYRSEPDAARRVADEAREG
ncbi:MAG: hypothetical protein ACRDD1_14710, partial [Planctomycetia bacterium]